MVGAGSWIVDKNGKLKRVEETTQDHKDGNCAREADGTPIGKPPTTIETPAAGAAKKAE